VNLDDRGGSMAEAGQLAAERASGSAMSPEYVRRLSRQKIAVEMPGSTSGESVECIAGVASRQSIGSITPAEQPPRNDPNARAISQQAKEQVPVFRPPAVSVAKLGEYPASDDERGMCDRALDESVPPDHFRIFQGMQPGFITSASIVKFAPGKATGETAERVEIRIVLESRALQPESIAMHPVVGVHACDDRGRAKRDARIESRDQTLVGSSFDAKARVLDGEPLCDCEGPIARAIVDQDTFPGAFGLAKHASQTHGKRGLRVPGGQ
jgi:hypothetical protein